MFRFLEWKASWRDRVPRECLQSGVSKDGSLLAVACGDGNVGSPGEVIIYDAASHEVRWKHDWGVTVTVAVFSPGGETLAVGGWGSRLVGPDRSGKISIYGAASGELRRELDCVIPPHKRRDAAWVESISYSPDGSRLAVVCANHAAIYEVETWVLLRRLDRGSGYDTQFENAVAFSSDGLMIAVGGSDNRKNGISAVIREASSGSVQHEIGRGRDEYHRGHTVEALTFSSTRAR